MTGRFVSWDIETVVVEGGQPTDPMEIFVAAVAIEPDGPHAPEVVFWEFDNGDEVEDMLKELLVLDELGYILTTCNGASFDFKQLMYSLPDYHHEIAQLCARHFDPTCVVLCRRGFPVGLDAMASYMVGEGKIHSTTLNDGITKATIEGVQAYDFWKRGEREAVKTYLKGDVMQQLALAQAIRRTNTIKWQSKSGKLVSVRAATEKPTSGLMMVEEAIRLPVPNTSWMSEPIDRQASYRWIMSSGG